MAHKALNDRIVGAFFFLAGNPGYIINIIKNTL
jgi:hypothetical protein